MADLQITAHDALRRRVAMHEASHATAALTFGIPIIAVTIDADTPYLHRGRYRPSHSCGLDCLVTMCLAGPCGEESYVGPILDGSDQADIEMTRDFLSRRYGPVQIGFQLARLRDSARAFVCTPLARMRIPLLAVALLRHGSLSGAELAALMVGLDR